MDGRSELVRTRRSGKGWILAGLVLLSALASALTAVSTRSIGATSPSGLVYAEGTRLMQDGVPVQFFGTNDDMAFVYTQWGDYGRNYMFPDFDGTITGVSNADQFWKKYFQYFLHYQQTGSPRPNLFRVTVGWDFGGEDAYYAWKNDRASYYENFDAMVSWAKAAGVYLVPMLMQSPNDRPYMWEYFNPDSARYGHLVEYERGMMTRYANEPQIAMWDVFNEADVSLIGLDYWPLHGGFNAFKAWEQKLVDDVRSATSHLITIGHAMTSAEYFFPFDGFGYDRSWYMRFSDIRGVDVSQIHVYSTAEDQYLVDWLAGWARELNKPMFVGELGYNAYPSPTGAPVPYGHWPWYVDAWRRADVGPVADMTWLDNGRGAYADYPYFGSLPEYPPSPPSPPSNDPIEIPTNAFRGRYYDNQDFTNLKVERIDAAIDFSWGLGSPDPAIAPDTFSVRWEGNWDFSQSGTYRFTMTTDDGMRVWVDGALVFESWIVQPPTTYTRDIPVNGGRHAIKVDYFEATGEAVARVSWAYVGGLPGSPGIPTNAFRGRYYDNPDFTNLKVERIDAAIDFDWGKGSPDPSMGANRFSVRWEGNWDFSQTGTYRFTMTTDDGMRVWVDSQLVLDVWFQQPRTEYTRDVDINAGLHTIRVDYYENTGEAVAIVSWALR